MSLFQRRNRHPAAAGEEKTIPGLVRPLTGIPVIGELFTIGPLLPKLFDLLRDNRGKMSSKRFGAGALVASGIVLVNAGAETDTPVQYWCGLGLCTLGVVLFALTRFEWTNEQDGEQVQEPPSGQS